MVATGPAAGRAVAVLALGLAAVGALAACSGSSAHRDDRARVRAAVEGFATRLVSLHDIGTVTASAIGDCRSAGWAPVSWSAPLTQRTTDPLEQENNVIGVAGTGPLRLDVVRILNPPAPHEPAAVYSTEDGRTQLTLTVTGQRTVRVDGFVSCPKGG